MRPLELVQQCLCLAVACWSDQMQLVAGWNDMTGALSYQGQHHVFQGCAGGGQPGSAAKGWHHASSADLVHWADRGIDIDERAESWEGFISKDSPCSGFVTVDDGGMPCAGFRQCSSTTGESESARHKACVVLASV